MHKQLILLLGMVLGGPLPTTAQTSVPQTVQVRDRITSIRTTVRTVREPSPGASFLPPENPGKPAAHFSYPFARVYQRDQHPEGLESLSPMREVGNLSLTESSPPPLQFWGGRLRRAGPLHMQHVQLGPLPAGGLQDFVPPRPTYPGVPFSVGLYGVSLSYHFGRNAHIGHSTQIWRHLGRVLGATR
jgi:hypothetical protein